MGLSEASFSKQETSNEPWRTFKTGLGCRSYCQSIFSTLEFFYFQSLFNVAFSLSSLSMLFEPK